MSYQISQLKYHLLEDEYSCSQIREGNHHAL